MSAADDQSGEKLDEKLQSSLENSVDWAGALDASSALVRRFEETFDVNKLTFRGIRAWPRLRSMMTFAYSDGLFTGRNTVKTRFGTLAAMRHVLQIPAETAARGKQAAEEANREGKRRAGRPIAFIGRARPGDAPPHPLFDPLIGLSEAAGNKFVSLFTDPSPAQNGTSPDRVTLDFEAIVNWLAEFDMAYDLLTGPPASAREVAGLDEFIATLPGDLAKNFSTAAVVKDLAFIDRLAIALRIYLEAAMPPVIFFSGQRRINMAITLAARQLNIPTVDVQHGASAYSPTMYKWHSWLRIPDEGYELLPDYFWVWGEQPARNIEATANPRCSRHKPIIGGHPAFLVAEDNFRFARNFTPVLKRAMKRILVTLGHLDRDGLPARLLEAMAAAPGDWRWLLRLHPRDASNQAALDELQTRLASAGVMNVEFEISSSAPLTSLLRLVDWHVTPYSSSVVEASGFGVPTLFVDPLGKAIFGHFLTRDGFYYAEAPSDIVARLSAQAQAPASLLQADRTIAQAELAKLLSPAG